MKYKKPLLCQRPRKPQSRRLGDGARPLCVPSLAYTTKGAEVQKRASAASHRVGNTTANHESSTISIDAISCYERLYGLSVRKIVDVGKALEYLMFMIFKLQMGQVILSLFVVSQRQ
ncbi:Hypothetical protein CINCED_3A012842 [Cinara cedri]|uniref:Uncharacterized protein n=1 Tax=Cinara cedri TaxID=506608 RepID=A0A5E4NDI6_9HEMI|nr:Hypothetical protein CINCED_3A012842 [Cinara cedri]